MIGDPASLVAIQALVTEFAYRIDHGESDLVADLFATDGWYGRENGARSVGHDAIRAAYAGRLAGSPQRLSRHLFTNLRVTFDSDGSARGTSTLILIAGDGSPPLPMNVSLVQDYHDHYVRLEGRWLFASRETKRLFVGDGFGEVLNLGSAG